MPLPGQGPPLSSPLLSFWVTLGLRSCLFGAIYRGGQGSVRRAAWLPAHDAEGTAGQRPPPRAALTQPQGLMGQGWGIWDSEGLDASFLNGAQQGLDYIPWSGNAPEGRG